MVGGYYLNAGALCNAGNDIWAVGDCFQLCDLIFLMMVSRACRCGITLSCNFVCVGVGFFQMVTQVEMVHQIQPVFEVSFVYFFKQLAVFGL